MSTAFLLPFLLLAGAGAGAGAGAAVPAPAEPVPGDETDSGPWVTKSFVILKSTANYREARSIAESSAKHLGVKLDLRGLTPTPEIGLTLSKSDCAEDGWDFPCYWPRGRFDDGVYISVEHSSGYEDLTDGLYIVVLANGSPEDADLQKAFRKAKARYRDAYIKSIPIYLGCVH